MSTTPSRHYGKETGSLVKLTGPDTSRTTLGTMAPGSGLPRLCFFFRMQVLGPSLPLATEGGGPGNQHGLVQFTQSKKGSTACCRKVEWPEGQMKAQQGAGGRGQGPGGRGLSHGQWHVPAVSGHQLPHPDPPPTYTHMYRDPRRCRKPRVSTERGVMAVHL